MNQLDAIKTWRTARLGCLYLCLYVQSREDPTTTPNLEGVAKLLGERDWKEVKDIQDFIAGEVRRNARSKNYDIAEFYNEMLQHFNRHVYN